MVIRKVINNNVVSAQNDSGKEIVVTGCGVGFHKKPGEYVDESRIEKIYQMENEEALAKFKDLLRSLPLEHIQVSNEIISFAKKGLGVPLNQNVYITLTDHINFAIGRFKEGTFFKSALANEIQYFYPSEYGVGRYALELIEKKTGIRLPEDEASSIALHLVNAELDLRVSDAFRLTTALQELLELLEEEPWFPEEEGYERKLFLTNLKYLVNRMMFGTREETEDKKLSEFIKANYVEEYKLAEKMRNFLQTRHHCEMQPDEEIYLALDMKRLRDNAGKK